MSTRSRTKSAAVRETPSYPVIDADGHMLEHWPLAMEYLREIGGREVHAEFVGRLPVGTRNIDGGPDRIGGTTGWYGLSKQERKDKRVTRSGFWGVITAKTLDRATVMLPDLFRDDPTISGSTSYGLSLAEFLRERPARNDDQQVVALNMYADLYGPHRDRLTVPALIPQALQRRPSTKSITR